MHDNEHHTKASLLFLHIAVLCSNSKGGSHNPDCHGTSYRLDVCYQVCCVNEIGDILGLGAPQKQPNDFSVKDENKGARISFFRERLLPSTDYRMLQHGPVHKLAITTNFFQDMRLL